MNGRWRNYPSGTRDTPVSSTQALDWNASDQRAVDNVRVLAMDAVQKSGNGHPGTAMSLAPLAYLLFNKVMTHDPHDPAWPGRDRFVLSCGHSSLTLYIQLFLSGYPMSLEDLRSLRQWGSQTPGHPEHGHTPGVEVTTGPLGQGVGNAVGMAMAARRERGLLDPDAAAGQSPFDHFIWAIASDGDMEEGISGEAASLGGHQQLGNLCLIYDDNKISIEDDTNVALSEDVAARYEAYGWHVQHVDFTAGGDYKEDVRALYNALQAAKAETGKPSFIQLRTIIAWPAPSAQNTGKAHGSALGEGEVKATKEVLGFDPAKTFEVDEAALARAREVVDRGATAHRSWDEAFGTWADANSERKALYDRLTTRTLPDGWEDALPSFPADPKGKATRAASGEVINALVSKLPELWGGSADLAESNNTTAKGEPSFLPPDRQTKMFPGGPYGRTLHFGIREHAMGAVMNGIVLHGGTRPYGGTFLVFSDYMRPAVRLAALMHLPTIYVWTHDSIGLGEDGPTHQPIEHLTALRAIPGLDVVRPADANETAIAWRQALRHTDRPTALALSRQNLPTLDREKYAPAENAAKGAYVVSEASGGAPEVILLATGSELGITLTAQERLEADGTPTRVVSVPCIEWFNEQDAAYREEVIPKGIKARVSVEAGIAMPWRALIGDAGESVSIEHFGASAPASVLFEQFGFTPDNIVAAAHASLARVSEITGTTTGT
jgi:transketolase